MCSWPNGKRSASDQLIGGLNTMVHNGSRDRESCSDATVAARPLISTARGSVPVECPNRAETHLDQLLRDVDCLRRERDEAAGGLAQQAEITRELDELYAQIGLVQAPTLTPAS
jgi:hypothetical protein